MFADNLEKRLKRIERSATSRCRLQLMYQPRVLQQLRKSMRCRGRYTACGSEAVIAKDRIGKDEIKRMVGPSRKKHLLKAFSHFRI